MKFEEFLYKTRQQEQGCRSNCSNSQTYSEFFLRLAIGFYMLIFQPPVNFCSDKNIQTIFGTKLGDFLNYRIDYNLISQTVEKVVKNSILCYEEQK
jgi:hypothetical protein